ncbi:MAG: Hsp20/alpha crystallin family protein [Elusimicrobia bacterium]|nr:Hsp20/alpha crystallin family protein [Elusimicrobiota bacterium]
MQKSKEMPRQQASVTLDPFREMLGLRDSISGLFEDFFSGRSLPGRYARPEVGGAWSPAVSIRETDSDITVYVALPGVEKEDVRLEIQDEGLVLSGKTRLDFEGEGWLRSEVPSGEFYRAFSMPAQIKPEGVKASWKNGLLCIEMPKAEEAKPRKIQIE